jgi:hypothetical protein
MKTRYRSALKIAVRTICVIAALWVGACFAIYHVMRQPPEEFGHVMAKMPGPVPFLVLPFETLWLRARAGKLAVGDSAPDFALTTLDKSDHIRLSALTAQARPVVLVFGSYT